MKNIEISGKRQKDKIKKANDPNNSNIIATRDCMNSIPDELFKFDKQKSLINRIYPIIGLIAFLFILTCYNKPFPFNFL